MIREAIIIATSIVMAAVMHGIIIKPEAIDTQHPSDDWNFES